ncbi:MAG: hypothetical protein B7C24_18280 [Bacteroidetes bacterium 4572_77]|nr:MAG: hypothetical protein B7C24_18280 [Bacteroidetes bacterium 4572_77]
MKKQLLVIVLILGVLIVDAQNYWFKKIESPNYQQPVGDILIKDGEYYFSIVESDMPQTYFGQYHSIINKINNQGEIEQSSIFHAEKKNLLGTMSQLSNGNILAMGHIYMPEQDGIFGFWQIEFDEDFCVIEEKLDTNDIGFGYIMNSIPDNNNGFIYHLSVASAPFNLDFEKTYLVRTNSDKTLINDTVFNVWSFDIAPNFTADNSYCNAFHYSGEGNWVDSSAANKIDTNFNEVHFQVFDTAGFWFHTPNHNGIDTFEERVYVGGNFGYFGQDQYYSNYVSLVIMDTSLNILEQRFYGGDGNYMLNSIKVTPEGDVLLLGHCSDVGPNVWNTFILKVDGDGLLTSSNSNMQIPIKNAIVLPNPGRNYLELHTAEYPAEFLLYDINGKSQ